MVEWVYLIAVSGNVAEPCLFRCPVFPILVFAQFAGDTSEMVVVTSGQSTQLLLRLVEFPD